jgi:hypothetical protein
MKVFTPQKIAATATRPMTAKMIFFRVVAFSGGAAADSRPADGGVVDGVVGCGIAACGFVVAGSVVVPMLLILCAVDPKVSVIRSCRVTVAP